MSWVNTRKAVVSLPPVTFRLSGAGAKTSFVYLQKKRPGDEQGPVFMAVANEVGFDVRQNKEVLTGVNDRVLHARETEIGNGDLIQIGPMVLTLSVKPKPEEPFGMHHAPEGWPFLEGMAYEPEPAQAPEPASTVTRPDPHPTPRIPESVATSAVASAAVASTAVAPPPKPVAPPIAPVAPHCFA